MVNSAGLQYDLREVIRLRDEKCEIQFRLLGETLQTQLTPLKESTALGVRYQ
jgi:hypothetical protein